MTELTESQKAVRKQWVEALRSGKYQQGRYRLRKIIYNGTEGFCCLGVLCDIVSPELWKADKSNMSNEWLHNGGIAMPSATIREAAGLEEDEIDLLMKMNDEGIASFEDIANQIGFTTEVASK